VLKVRKDQKPGDYTDPGWYEAPANTRARLYEGPLPESLRQKSVPDAGKAADLHSGHQGHAMPEKASDER
jgi:hypothetical protein